MTTKNREHNSAGYTEHVNLRAIVLDMLYAILEEGQYSHLVLRQTLEKYQYLTKQERAFITRLAEGTVERGITIDYVIGQYSSVMLRKLKPVIRTILRMSVYQIYYMDGIPDRAVCNEAVKLAKKRGFTGLSGFVNGVLRSIAQGRSTWKLPDRQKNLLTYLSVKYSIPEWMADLWCRQYGSTKAEQIMAGFDGETPTSIRVNLSHNTPQELREKLEQEGVTVTEVAGIDYAFYISGYDYLASLDSFVQGDFYVQDVSSMQVSVLAAPKKDDYVIDVCAAPGGKSVHMAELLAGTGMVEARDLTAAKVSLIEENIARHGLTNMRARQWDATVRDEESVEKADILICDLPCSGLGVLGRKVDIRYKTTPEQVEELAALQRQILAAVHDYVKPGGTLIYSTCTIAARENEENVAWFRKEHPEYELVSQQQILPGQTEGLVTQDGFFLAKLIRR